MATQLKEKPTLEPVAQLCPKTLFGIKNLNICYGDNLVLRDVSMDICRGSVTAIVGPSGCGKTSFLHSLNRLCEMSASCDMCGSIFYRGKNIYDRSFDVAKLRAEVGTIFQTPTAFPMSIWNNLAFPLKEHGVRSKAEILGKVTKTLQDVGLWDEVKDRLDCPAEELSGGQMQRLCIARALVLEPSTLLMDEPCSSLDPIASSTVEELILKLKESISIIIVTHNLSQARRLSDYTALFWADESSGYLVEFDETEKMFTRPSEELTTSYFKGEMG